MPRVTIGVPVFNGATLLRESLDCLAAQTLRDFDVILSDNGSTDGTTAICAEFAARDSRFRHHRREDTVGAVENFFYARDQATSPLFLWRAFDDLSEPNYLQVLADLHDAQPRAVLAVGQVQRAGLAGATGRLFPYAADDDGGYLGRFYRQIFRNSAAWYYGMWKHAPCVTLTNRVRAVYPDVWGADQVSIFACALQDAIRGSNATIFYQRVIPETRNYEPRPLPTYPEMTARNARFSSACRTLLDEADLPPMQKRVIAAMIPFFTNRFCHPTRRLLKARLRG